MSTLFKPTDSPHIKPRQTVFPGDWTNPEPSGKYNLVVMGAGLLKAWLTFRRKYL